MSLLRWKQKIMSPDGGVLRTGGGGSGGGPTQTTTYSTNIPEYARPYVENMLQSTQAQIYNEDMTGFRPYQPYSTDVNNYFAGFSPLQQQAQQSAYYLQAPSQFQAGSELAGAAGVGGLGAAEQAGILGQQALGYGATGAEYGGMGAQQALQTARQTGRQAGMYGRMGAGYGARGVEAAEQGFGAGEAFARQATDPYATAAYMSPYMQNVIDFQKSQALRDYGIGQGLRKAQAVGAGAFGGSRQAIAEAEAERALGSQLQGITATGSQKAFEDAQRQQQFAAQLGLQGLGAGYQGLGLGMQGAGLGLQGVGAQQAAGQLGLAGTAQGIQGAQAGLAGVGQAIGAGQYGLGGLGAATQAAGALGQLGGAQFGAQKDIIGLQSQMGAQQQALEQQKINQAIQDYAIAQQYPFMQLGLMNAMLRGLPLQTQTTQLYQAQPSSLQQGIGLIGAGSTLFGRRTGGMIKEYREGGITEAYAPGGVVDKTRADLEEIADMPGGVQRLEQIKNSSASSEVRKMAAQVIMEKQMEARAQQQAQQARMSGIAMAGGPAFATQGMAGGGIVAFNGEEDSLVMLNPEFGGGEQPVDVRRPMTVEELFREYPGLEGKVGIAQIQDYTSGRSAPPESARAKPTAPTPAPTAAPKPEAKPPVAAAPTGGAPVERGVAALTGIKSLEQQMAEQERLMGGPSKVGESLEAKIAERLGGMSKREKQDELAAIRKAFVGLGTKAAPGGFFQAATEAIGTYGEASDAARKAREGMEIELTKMQADIEKGRRLEKRGNLDAAQKAYDSAENRQLRVAEMQNQLKVAGISASRPGEIERAFALYQKDPAAFEQFKRASSLQDDAVKQRANQAAAEAFQNQRFLNFGNDKKYIELKKAAQSGNEKAIEDLRQYELQQFQKIRNMILNPEEAIGGGSAAVPQGVTVKKIG